MASRNVTSWLVEHGLKLVGCLWATALLGVLAWLNRQNGGMTFLVPPFAATLTIMVYLPNAPVARPVAVVCGSVFGAAIGTVLSLFLGVGADVATLAAVTTMVLLPLARVFHPPGVALAMCPALLHLGLRFPIEVVLPFTLAAVLSWALIKRLLEVRATACRDRASKLAAQSWVN
jgi:CBS-domain-containing membrane protein